MLVQEFQEPANGKIPNDHGRQETNSHNRQETGEVRHFFDHLVGGETTRSQHDRDRHQERELPCSFPFKVVEHPTGDGGPRTGDAREYRQGLHHAHDQCGQEGDVFQVTNLLADQLRHQHKVGRDQQGNPGEQGGGKSLLHNIVQEQTGQTRRDGRDDQQPAHPGFMGCKGFPGEKLFEEVTNDRYQFLAEIEDHGYQGAQLHQDIKNKHLFGR